MIVAENHFWDRWTKLCFKEKFEDALNALLTVLLTRAHEMPGNSLLTSTLTIPRFWFSCFRRDQTTSTSNLLP